MDFEEYLLSFINKIKKCDIDNIIPLLLIHGLVTEDDLLDSPNQWLTNNCEIIAQGDSFAVYQETGKRQRIFIEDAGDDYTNYAITTECTLVATEEVPIDDAETFKGNLAKYDAQYCAELWDSVHCNAAGETVTTLGWFKFM